MRTGKRMLAGVAAGALGAGMLVGLSATSAQATTYGVSSGYPSATVIAQNVGSGSTLTIPVSYTVDGNKTVVPSSPGGWAVTMTKDDSAAVNPLTTSAGSDGTKFLNAGVAGSTATGYTWTLQSGASNAYDFSSIPTGGYKLTFTVLATTGVALASTTIPITVVSVANSSTVLGSATLVDSAGDALPPETVSTAATLASTNGTMYAYIANATGGPIVAASGLAGLTAFPTQTPTTSLSTYTSNGAANSAAGYLYSFTAPSAATDKWSSTPTTAGEFNVTFAEPFDQISGVLGVTVFAESAIVSGSTIIASAVKGSISGTPVPTPTASAAIPATNGVKFTVTAVAALASAATTGVAGIPATFSVTPVDGTNGTDDTASYTSVSPSLPVSTTSGVGGALSQEFTVSNPVAGRGIRVQVSVPGASATYYIQFQRPTVTTLAVPASNITAANTGQVSVVGTVVDQFGTPLANWPVQVTATGVAATGTTPANLTTNASGVVTYTYSVPASTISGSTTTVTMSAWNGTAYDTGSALRKQVIVTYTSGSAAVATLTATGSFSPATTSAYGALSATGALNGATNPMFVNTAVDLTATASVGSQDGYSWSAQVVARNTAGTAIAGAAITVTAPTGGYVYDATTAKWASSTTVYTNTSGIAYAVMTSTKTGAVEWQLASGTASAKVSALYANRPTDARAVDIAVSPTKVNAGSGATVTATVTDRFGNVVPGVPVAFAETGPGYIAGSGTGNTAANGTLEATFVSVSGQTGISTLTASVSTATVSVNQPSAYPSAAAQVYAPQTLGLQVGNRADVVTNYAVNGGSSQSSATVLGVAAGVATKNIVVEVTGGVADKSIVIIGERGTVSGKPGILVSGETTGFEVKATVKPWIRFPGETAYTAGSARPEVAASGEFSWQRKTGKKIYVYFTSIDDAVKSNRIIIAAN